MADEVTALYNSLFAGNRVSVKLGSKSAYESLRVALSRKHQTPKLLLELTNDSLCATYDVSQGIGTFWLGTRRKASQRAAFTIISEEPLDAQIRSDLGTDQERIG